MTINISLGTETQRQDAAALAARREDSTLNLMTSEVDQLEEEAERASEMLRGKVVARVIRNRPTEVLLEFTDGTRLFVDRVADELELSVTGGK